MQYNWPFFNERVHRLKMVSGEDMSIERLHKILEADAPYYTIDVIVSKYENDTVTDKISKSYKCKQMEGCFNANREPLYAWMYKICKGSYKNIQFSTINEFETAVSNNINNKIIKL